MHNMLCITYHKFGRNIVFNVELSEENLVP